ncbi:MAG: acetyl-CoA C-acetyltransferase [Acidobacteriota bacterium]
MYEAVIVGAVRTPLGRFNGMLASMGATELGAIVIENAIKRAGIAPTHVDEVVMGQVLPCGYGQNPARQASLKAGLPFDVGCVTVNKVCGSGLKAVMLAAQAVQTGDAEVVVAGGMESMTRAPYYLDKARFGYRMGDGQIQDHMLHDGLWDIVNDFHMGMANELCCERFHISRDAQDRYAERSYQRALAAQAAGFFDSEIVPVVLRRQQGEPVVLSKDECLRETSFEILSGMEPVFRKDGIGTVGNASAISDGAAAVVVMSRKRAQDLGCGVIAAIGAQASAGVDLRDVLVAPVQAIPKCLAKEGIDLSQVDLIELNEAFAGSTCAVMQELGMAPEKTNIHGGSVALGHPLGATGCRILVTLLYAMTRNDKKTGMASLCLGGGEAVAMIVRR